MGLEIVKAKGTKLWDKDGKEYIDFISGISVNNTGHLNPSVVNAINNQLKDFSYLMVYGEYIHSPQVKLSKYLSDQLPESLNATFIVNSGSEAIEGALKLAKRVSGRPKVMAFNKSYHGSTYGAMSLGGEYERKQAFMPGVPGVINADYNDLKSLDHLNKEFAAVVVELVQAEAGVHPIEKWFLEGLVSKCKENNILIIADEVQTGMGRTGKLFAFEHFNFIPDILVLAKGLGGGMPIGCFISSKDKMNMFREGPVLGHITTFGGHPVCCAAALANMEFIVNNKLVDEVRFKEEILKSKLNHPKIKALRSFGLIMALEFDSSQRNMEVIKACLKRGLITDWFLYADQCLRIAPPLTVNKDEIAEACKIINESIEEVYNPI
jgi:acetylornithine/succinyldiaminopimelate/putrescine aminotransferase